MISRDYSFKGVREDPSLPYPRDAAERSQLKNFKWKPLVPPSTMTHHLKEHKKRKVQCKS